MRHDAARGGRYHPYRLQQKARKADSQESLGDFVVSGPQFVTYVWNTSQSKKADEVSHFIALVLCHTTPDMTRANSHSGS